MKKGKQREEMKAAYLRKSIYLVTALVLALMVTVMPLSTGDVWAAEGSASISTDSQVTKGDTFTVKVTYSGDYIGRVRGMMKYDTSVLKYISGGSSQGNGGAVELKGSGEGGDINFSIKFKAVGKGSSKLSLKTSDMYDLDEMDMGNPAASASVKVIPAASGETQTQDQEDEGKTDDDQDKDDEEDGQKVDDTDQQEVEEEEVPQPDEDADTELGDEDSDKGGVSDKTKIIAIIIAAVVSILAVNLMILRSRRKNR